MNANEVLILISCHLRIPHSRLKSRRRRTKRGLTLLGVVPLHQCHPLLAVLGHFHEKTVMACVGKYPGGAAATLRMVAEHLERVSIEVSFQAAAGSA
jgi:hypothetical protein